MVVDLSRREFLQVTAVGVAEASLSGAEQQPNASPAEIDALFDRAIVIDSLTSERWDDAGFAAWKKSGYTAIMPTVGAASRPRGRVAGEFWIQGKFEVAMKNLDQWHQRFAQRPDVFIHCTKAADIERAKREGKLAVILGFQQEPIHDDLENLDKLYAAGTRWIQLSYMCRNNLGDGCLERMTTGLSAFGIACVEKMNDLGIIVDVSHCGEGTTSDAIAFSRQPVACNHTVTQTVYARISREAVRHPRSKSDALLRALADKGGIVSISTLGYFVGPWPDTSLDDYLDHIEHAVNICGTDHVGVSTDHAIRGIEASGATRETWLEPRLRRQHSMRPRWPPWIPELDKPDRFRTVAHALAKRGLRAPEIEKILGRNWLRVLRDVYRG